jgi:hypothetical protein
MDTTRQFNPDLGTIPWSGYILDKVHHCENCPIRCKAVAKPRSLFARIHRWHTTWWPGWKVYLAEKRASSAREKASV